MEKKQTKPSVTMYVMDYGAVGEVRWVKNLNELHMHVSVCKKKLANSYEFTQGPFHTIVAFYLGHLTLDLSS